MMLNPIFESSARRRMRTIKTPLLISAYILLLILLAASQLQVFMGQGVQVTAMRLGMECYIWMTALELLLIILVAPALSAGSIAGERERRTFDLLLVTGVGAGRIVMGKLLESFVFLSVLILCGMPVMSLVLVTGGVSIWDVLMTHVYLLVIAFGALCAGMVVSVMMKRSLTAIIASYLLIFAIGAGTWWLAKHGPLAAAYTHRTLAALGDMNSMEIMKGMPVTIFFNPAVGLVMMLASQTGILHRTMQDTMRLQDIYTAAKAAGFGSVSLVSLVFIFAASIILLMAAALLLSFQSERRRKR